MKRFKPFTLLEVLIAIMLISLALPLLITPFFYASIDQRETIEKIRLEKAAQFAITLLLIDLQEKQISPKELEVGREYPIKTEWQQAMQLKEQLKGTYTFKKLKPTRDLPEEGPELWQVTFALSLVTQSKPSHFEYRFILLPAEVS